MLARSAIAFAAAIHVAACATEGPQVEFADVALRQRRRHVITVAVMHVDSAITAYPEHPLAPDKVTTAYRAGFIHALPSQLVKRRYRMAALIDARGRYQVGRARHALPESDVAQVIDSLGRYAEAQLRSVDRSMTLSLPRDLIHGTGADATLFVQSSGFAGDEQFDVVELLEVVQFFALLGADGGSVCDQSDAKCLCAAVEAEHARENAAWVTEQIVRRRPIEYPRSWLRLTMTLVDNRTGSVLWHSDRPFRADPTKPSQVRIALERSLRKLPRGSGPAPW